MHRIQSLQVLRAFAACAVVLVHSIGRAHIAWPDTPSWLTDETTHAAHGGVDLFFVLSGFLMAYLHRDHFGRSGASGKFLSRRLVRIVPIYWLLTGVALALTLYLPQLISSGRLIEWPWLLGNFLFVPIANSAGSDERLLIVGWTLDYEMLFYSLFAVALLWRKGLTILCGLMLGLVAAGLIWHPEHTVLRWLTSLMLLEFLAGIGVALLVMRYQPPRWVAWTLFAVACLALLASAGWIGHRILQWGAAFALLVAATVWLQFKCEGRTGRALVTVGDASYSIYLTQVFSLPALAVLMKIVGLRLQGDVTIIVLWLAACGLGVLFWWSVERPITELLKRWLLAPKVEPAAVPA
jgi:exopolysaccharide production protein ExoZ